MSALPPKADIRKGEAGEDWRDYFGFFQSDQFTSAFRRMNSSAMFRTLVTIVNTMPFIAGSIVDTRSRNASLDMRISVTLVKAMADAKRGRPSNKANSPRTVPFPNSADCKGSLPWIPFRISTLPERMTKAASPASPSSKIIELAVKLISSSAVEPSLFCHSIQSHQPAKY